MRNTMGRRLDGLNDEQRTRIITATDMNDGRYWWHWENGCGCLEGTIAGSEAEISSSVRFQLALAVELTRRLLGRGFEVETTMYDIPWKMAPASARYPRAVLRFGKERVVRAIKQRAMGKVRVEQARLQEVSV